MVVGDGAGASEQQLFYHPLHLLHSMHIVRPCVRCEWYLQCDAVAQKETGSVQV
jgi:hypothetical protein